ncbi:MAG: hypothetical protein Q9207_000014 [Kuettlingeria erythrocarpa]
MSTHIAESESLQSAESAQSEQSEHVEQPKQSDDHANQDSQDQGADVLFTPIFETGETELSEEVSNTLTPKHVAGLRVLESRIHQREEIHGDYNKDIKYTKFTFIVVDDQCLRSDPWEIIVACDAPDCGEADDETRVKYFRMPFEEGASCLNALEYLTMTPSEAATHSHDVLTGFPPVCMMPVRNEDGQWLGDMRPATREKGIKNKRRMLAED